MHHQSLIDTDTNNRTIKLQRPGNRQHSVLALFSSQLIRVGHKSPPLTKAAFSSILTVFHFISNGDVVQPHAHPLFPSHQPVQPARSQLLVLVRNNCSDSRLAALRRRVEEVEQGGWIREEVGGDGREVRT